MGWVPERKCFFCGLLGVTLVLVSVAGILAQQATIELPEDLFQSGGKRNWNAPVGGINWKIKTRGGLQFWTDVRHASGWRVQHNGTTKLSID